VCGEQGATLIGAGSPRPIATAVTDDGALGDRSLGPDVGTSAFDGMSNRRVALFQQTLGHAAGAVRVVLFHDGSWHSAAVPGEPAQFVYPDLTGEHLLFERSDDHWTSAPVK
jgi:hypothetical protein